jgi:Adenylosuccinate lyase
MISRYTLPEMGALWSEQTKFQKWLDVEIAVCEVHAEMGTIPRDALEQIKARAQFSVERINEIEKTTDHDVIAFHHQPGRIDWRSRPLRPLRTDFFRCRRYRECAAAARRVRHPFCRRSMACSKC